jgi:hypothetical protein
MNVEVSYQKSSSYLWWLGEFGVGKLDNKIIT